MLVWNYSELLQTGMVAGAVVLVLSIGKSHWCDPVVSVLTTIATFPEDSCKHFGPVSQSFRSGHDMDTHGAGFNHVRFLPGTQANH